MLKEGLHLLCSLCSALAARWLTLLLGILLGAAATLKGAERRARHRWRAQALALSDASAEDLKRILGELPPWVRDGSFEKARWFNTILRQLFPCIDKAVGDIVHAQVLKALGGLALGKYGIRKVALTHFSLGPAPKLAGLKTWGCSDEQPDAIVVDVDIRVSGVDPNAVAVITLVTGTELVIQLAALQFSGVARIVLRQLGPRLPPVGALTVSLIGYPFLDFSLTAIRGDLLAIPGLESAVAEAVKAAVKAYVWPQRMVIPLVADADVAALQPRATGALLLRLKQARNLPRVDFGPGASIDPYMRVSVENHPTVVETVHKSNTTSPVFNLEVVLPLVDIQHQDLKIELWDGNTLSKDKRVSTTNIFIGEVLSRDGASTKLAGGATLFSAWVPLKRCENSPLMPRMSVGREPEQKSTVMSDGGEILLEFIHVPYAKLGAALPSPKVRLPPGWTMPTGCVLSVRLLAAKDLRAPSGWGRMRPFVTLTLGEEERVSRPSVGDNPAYQELFEFLHVDATKTPRLHMVLSAGPLKGAVGAAIGDAAAGVASIVSGAASIVTLGASRGAATEELQLRGRTGGLLGRVPRTHAEAEEVKDDYGEAFCGRCVADLRDIVCRCELAGGCVSDTLPLIDVPSGSLALVFELHRFPGVTDVDEPDEVPARATGDEAPQQAVDSVLPLMGGAPAEEAEPQPRGGCFACFG